MNFWNNAYKLSLQTIFNKREIESGDLSTICKKLTNLKDHAGMKRKEYNHEIKAFAAFSNRGQLLYATIMSFFTSFQKQLISIIHIRSYKNKITNSALLFFRVMSYTKFIFCVR